jgi:leucyl aminopeptidase (aminopeptidase T)
MDTDLQPGAENAIRICLDVQPHERVTVITDRETQDIADALVVEIDRIGSEHTLFVLEDLPATAVEYPSSMS